DRDVPAERLGAELLGALEAIVGAVESGVADLGGLQRLVDEERGDAEREGDGLEAEVDEGAAGDLHRGRYGPDAFDVGDVLLAEVGFDAGADVVEGGAEGVEALFVGSLGGACGLHRSGPFCASWTDASCCGAVITVTVQTVNISDRDFSRRERWAWAKQ